MKVKLLLGLAFSTCCGCSSMNHTESGAVGGGAVGALSGAGIGSLANAPGAGALIGAGTGAALGAAAGANADREERQVAVQQAHAQAAVQQAQANAPRLDEIALMSKNGVPDANIIAQIRGSGAAYNLNTDDIVYLSRNGVSSAVIGELQNHRPQPVVAQPVVYQRAVPVYVHDPYWHYPPPPVSVGVGFGFGPHHHHRRYR